MAELGTRRAIERVRIGNPLPNVARTSDLPEPNRHSGRSRESRANRTKSRGGNSDQKRMKKPTCAGSSPCRRHRSNRDGVWT